MQKLGSREQEHINSVLNGANSEKWKQNNCHIKAKHCGFFSVPLYSNNKFFLVCRTKTLLLVKNISCGLIIKIILLSKDGSRVWKSGNFRFIYG